MQRLERELGTKLFVRHGHGMALTMAGKMLAMKAAGIEEAALTVRNDLIGLDLDGRLRVHVSEGNGTHGLTPTLNEFYERYPGAVSSISAILLQPGRLRGPAAGRTTTSRRTRHRS